VVVRETLRWQSWDEQSKRYLADRSDDSCIVYTYSLERNIFPCEVRPEHSGTFGTGLQGCGWGTREGREGTWPHRLLRGRLWGPLAREPEEMCRQGAAAEGDSAALSVTATPPHITSPHPSSLAGAQRLMTTTAEECGVKRKVQDLSGARRNAGARPHGGRARTTRMPTLWLWSRATQRHAASHSASAADAAVSNEEPQRGAALCVSRTLGAMVGAALLPAPTAALTATPTPARLCQH